MPSDGGRAQGWRGRAVGLAYLGVVALQLVLIWSFPHPPTQDGGIHLQNGRMLLRLAANDVVAATFFEHRLAPTAAGEWGIAALLSVLGPADAERVLVSLFLLSYAAAVAWACGPRGLGAGLMALPLALGYPLHLGFYSFCFSLVGFVVLLGWWLRSPQPTPPGIFGRAFVAGLTAMAHPISAASAGLVLTSASLWFHWRATPGGVGERLRRATLRTAPLAVAFLPAAAFVVWVRTLQETQVAVGWPWGQRLSALLTLDVVSAIDARELLVSVALFVLLAGGMVAVVAERRRRREAPGSTALLLGCGPLLVLYLVAPNSYVTATGGTAGGWILHRLMLLLALSVILWLAAQPLGPIARRWLPLLATIVALSQLGLHAASWTRIHDLLREVDTARQAIRDDGVYLALVLDRRGVPSRRVSGKVRVFEHVAARLAAETSRIDLGNFAATTTLFPLAYRPEVNPAAHLPKLDGTPTPDLRSYERATGVSLDAIVVWGTANGVEREPRLRLFFTELEELGFRQRTDSPRGWLRVYRRDKAAAGGGPVLLGGSAP